MIKRAFAHILNEFKRMFPADLNTSFTPLQTTTVESRFREPNRNKVGA
jgi:hypothetical protein